MKFASLVLALALTCATACGGGHGSVAAVGDGPSPAEASDTFDGYLDTSLPTFAPDSPLPSIADTASAPNDIVAWLSGGGEGLQNRLAHDTRQLGTDASGGDFEAASVDCRTVRDDAVSAQAYEPLPLASAQQHWSKSLSIFIEATTDCIAGANSHNGAQLGTAARELGDADVELRAANAAVAAHR